MIDSKLHAGYTLYLSHDDRDNIVGGYLKKSGEGLIVNPLVGSEESLIDNFSNVLVSLKSGYTLQVYSHGFIVIAMLGLKTYEGPYGESECFNSLELVNGSGFLDCLIEMNKCLDKEKPCVYKKAYRLYGNDKYILEENL